MHSVKTKGNAQYKALQTMRSVKTKDSAQHKATQIMRNAKTKGSVQHKIVKERDQIKMAQIRANVRTKADQRKAATKIATKTIMATKTVTIILAAIKIAIKTNSIKKVKKVDSNKVISLLFHHVNSANCQKYWNIQKA